MFLEGAKYMAAALHLIPRTTLRENDPLPRPETVSNGV